MVDEFVFEEGLVDFCLVWVRGGAGWLESGAVWVHSGTVLSPVLSVTIVRFIVHIERFVVCVGFEGYGAVEVHMYGL